ncbi:pre-mRNA-splicing factor CWC22 [Lipomyces japonicus]|uniref:pre-mRNA-splicing factor CWC22 n=1 Tax=Lipomyces japonicus TaxID=56871 RepID=UPI0034CF65EC
MARPDTSQPVVSLGTNRKDVDRDQKSEIPPARSRSRSRSVTPPALSGRRASRHYQRSLSPQPSRQQRQQRLARAKSRSISRSSSRGRRPVRDERYYCTDSDSGLSYASSRPGSPSFSRPYSSSPQSERLYLRSLSRSVSRSSYSSSRSRSRSYRSSRSRSFSPAPSRFGSRSPSPRPRKRADSRSESPPQKRRRQGSFSRSPPPARRRSPPRNRLPPDIDRQRALERKRQAEERNQEKNKEEEVKEPVDPKAEYERLMELRSGGTYVPPARLRALQALFTEKDTKEFQRFAWEDLKKGLNGAVNKVNKQNIREVIQDIFKCNLIRGRGLFARSIMRAQAASLPFTPVYAAVVAVVNTKLPQLGELLVTRLIIQFRKAYRRNDKPVCISSTMFLAHLCNYQVAHEIVILQILHLLLERPTDDSVEIAVGFMREVGAFLQEASSSANNGVFERFRAILHEGQLEKRTQYMIEVLFLVRKNHFEKNPIIQEELDLVEEDDQITHMIGLDDQLNGEDTLNVFKFDSDFEESEAKYKVILAEILGDDDDEEGSDEDSDESSDDEEETAAVSATTKVEIQDMTSKNLVNLRRTIYLTIRSSMDYEECCHKLLKLQVVPEQEIELVNMVIECCSQEKTYMKFYGLIGERFCRVNRKWRLLFEQAFGTYYDTIHRYETNQIRNISNFFGYLLARNAVHWTVLEVIHLNEDETTASSRIFIKILFEHIVEELGFKKTNQFLQDPELMEYVAGVFPKDNPRDTRFAINFFTAIKLGVLTDDLREHLSKNVTEDD